MLETERLRLRRPRRDDVEALAPTYADPEVVRWLGGRVWTPSEFAARVERWLAHWDEHGVGLFVCERKDDGAVIGRVGLLVWDPRTWTHGIDAPLSGPLETELGWTLGREHWGRGYATEGARAVRDWAFGERGLERLISLIRPENAASVRVAEKLGAHVEREVEVAGYPTRIYALRRKASQRVETAKPSDS